MSKQQKVLAPGDPRHGTNGYRNYGCRCDICREAATKEHYQRYTKIALGGLSIDAPREVATEFKKYAQRKGVSMRQIGLQAIAEFMERNP